MSPSHAKYHTYTFRLLTGPPRRSPQIQSSLFSCLCQTVQFLKHLCLGAEQAMLTSAGSNSEISASCVSPQRFRIIYFLNLPSPLFQYIRAVLAFCRLQSTGCALTWGLARGSGEILVTCQREIPGIWWSPSLSSQPGWLPVPWAAWQPAGQGRIAPSPCQPQPSCHSPPGLIGFQKKPFVAYLICLFFKTSAIELEILEWIHLFLTSS